MTTRCMVSLSALLLATASLLADDKPAADPAATRLLAEARAARASWTNFPGFTADIAVNTDGKVARGTVTVGADGKVKIDGLDKSVESWAKGSLASIAGHRLDDGSPPHETPCAFADNVEHHPMGRAIRVLNDELHSSYRIRDRQITEVNREMKDKRFTISVLENKPNAEGKFLSANFVVNYWSLENGELLRSETTQQTWARVGKFDLPAVTLVLTAAKQKSGEAEKEPATRSLTLTNHKLLELTK